jgi:hypothetical protein
VRAREIVSRPSINQEAIAGDDGPVAETEILVSKDLFHREGISKSDFSAPLDYTIPILSMRRWYITVSTSSDRFRQERRRKKANEALRCGRRVILHSTLLSCLCLSSGFLAVQSRKGTSRGSTQRGDA